MALKFSTHQILVLITVALAATLFVVLSIDTSESVATTSGKVYPCIGKPDANVEILIFEDFLCSGCYKFHRDIFPKVYSRYVESGDARFMVVPLGFLEGSKPLANAALAVYKLSPDRFLEYSTSLFQRFESQKVEGAVEDILLDVAINVGDIDLKELKRAIKTRVYYEEVDRNLDWARTVMGNRFRLPAVYVNGIAGSTRDLEELEILIEKRK